MKIITVSREYGAGGHSIGRAIAKELGIEFYDRDIIKATAEQSGIERDLIEQDDEEFSTRHSILKNIIPISYDQKDEIFEAQKSVILDIAKKGPCVILGRCADQILKEAGVECLHVFLYAHEDARIKRVGELIGSDNEEVIKKTIKKTDHNRHSYYTYYTDQQWGDYRNYQMVLDTGVLGYDTCIKLICDAARAVD